MSPITVGAVIWGQDNCAMMAQTYGFNLRGARVLVPFYIFCCRIDGDHRVVGMLR
jgi:hypothetical protein